MIIYLGVHVIMVNVLSGSVGPSLFAAVDVLQRT